MVGNAAQKDNREKVEHGLRVFNNGNGMKKLHMSLAQRMEYHMYCGNNRNHESLKIGMVEGYGHIPLLLTAKKLMPTHYFRQAQLVSLSLRWELYCLLQGKLSLDANVNV